MKIEIKDNIDKSGWKNLVKQDGYSIFKTTEWANFVNDNPKYIVATNKNKIVGGMIFWTDKILIKKILVSNAPPLAVNNHIRKTILDFFKRMKGIKVIDTTYQDNKFDNLFLESGFKPTEKATVIVDLSKYEDTKKFLDKDGRYDVNKALKQNVKVINTTDEKYLKNFYRIYYTAGREWGIKILNEIEFMKFKNLFLKNLAKLFLSMLDDQIVSGAIVLNSGDTVIFYINATNPEMKHIQANTLLVWEIMNYAKKNGFKYFDLFGYDLYAKKNEKTYRINKFKLGFGGEIKRFYKFTDSDIFVMTRNLYNKIRSLKKLYFLFQRRW